MFRCYEKKIYILHFIYAYGASLQRLKMKFGGWNNYPWDSQSYLLMNQMWWGTELQYIFRYISSFTKMWLNKNVNLLWRVRLSLGTVHISGFASATGQKSETRLWYMLIRYSLSGFKHVCITRRAAEYKMQQLLANGRLLHQPTLSSAHI